MVGVIFKVDPPRRWTRRTISVLIDTGPVGDPSWRWSLGTVLRLVGPGSVPFGFLMFAVQNQVLRTNYGVGSISLGIALLIGGAIVAARFQPPVAWLMLLGALVWTAATATALTGDPWPFNVPQLFAVLVVQFALSRDSRVWISLPAWAVMLLVGSVIGRSVPEVLAQQNLLLVGMLSGAALVVGSAVRVSNRARRRVAEEERLTARERERRALLEERTRIARELHDVVAHHMSVITVQASTAEYRIAGLSEPARAEFESIADQARESLTEMRRLLAVLRSEDDAVLRAPQPGLERVDALIDSATRAGIRINRSIADLPEDLPEAVSLAGYRIVQESLSNVVRHASGAETFVTVAVDVGELMVSVVNTAPSSQVKKTAPLPGAGLGLAGMRERVSLAGGRVTAEPTSEGGFVVEAVLPLRAKGMDEENRT